MTSGTLRNPDAEAALLGLYLRHADGFARYPTAAAAYTEPRYAAVYRALRALAERGDPLDVALVAAEAARHGASAADVFELAEHGPPTLAGGRTLLDTVVGLQRRRGMERAASLLRELAQTQDMAPEEAIAKHLEFLTAETATVSTIDAPTADVAGVEWLTALAEAELAGSELRTRVLLTGYAPLDHVLGDLARGEVCVVAGRPGTGKSAFGTQVGAHNAQARRHVLLASAEMPRRQVIRRLYSMLCDVALAALRTTETRGLELLEAEWQRIRTTTLPQLLRIFVRPAMTVQNIVDMALRVAVQTPLDLVVVDHLHHLADQGSEKRHELLGQMMLALKALAVRHDCAVLVLAQLNRAGDDVPTLRHLREAGAIEEIASSVVLLHRPKPEEATVDVYVAKNRDGEVGLVTLRWEGRFVRFAA